MIANSDPPTQNIALVLVTNPSLSPFNIKQESSISLFIIKDKSASTEILSPCKFKGIKTDIRILWHSLFAILNKYSQENYVKTSNVVVFLLFIR